MPVRLDDFGGLPQARPRSISPFEELAITLPSPKMPPSAYASRPSFTRQPLLMSNSEGSGMDYHTASETPVPPPRFSLVFPKGTFSFVELERATKGFSNVNLLGQGSSACVHKGILPNGQQVAVKQMRIVGGDLEFYAEIQTISRVRHKHLVSLLGYCITGDMRLLVYEFVPNNTLEYHLHGKKIPVLDWSTRFKIALGSAKGLAFLHEDCHPRIIHGDVKASNILLDFEFEAKVADFGLLDFSTNENTLVLTREMDTSEYLSPNYTSCGKITEKTDVFMFGVVLLELITGRRPVDSTNAFVEDTLVDWARPLLGRALQDGNFEALAYAKLPNYIVHQMACMVACAAACIRHSARRRPRIIQVVRVLEGNSSSEILNEGLVDHAFHN